MANATDEEISNGKKGRFTEPTNDGKYSPLNEPVKKRSYTAPEVKIEGVIRDIPEAKIEPQTINLNGESTTFGEPNNPNGGGGGGGGNTSGGGANTGGAPSSEGNTALNELSKKEKLEAAEKTVDFALGLYKGLNKFAHTQFIAIDDTKMIEMQQEGIDMRYPITLANGKTIEFQSFLLSYNDSTEEVLTVSEEFVGTVRDPMVRIAMKKNLAMTDENIVIIAFLGDILSKAWGIGSLKKSLNFLAKSIKDNTLTVDANVVHSQPSQPAQPTSQPEHPAPDVPPAPVSPQNTQPPETVIPTEPTVVVTQPSDIRDYTKSGERNFSSQNIRENEFEYAEGVAQPLNDKEYKKRGRAKSEEDAFVEPEETK